jgi:Family of unknown function (DUF5994)
MPASPTASTPSPAPSERVPLRIRLDNSFQSGPVDGAWWPQSRDLQTEAADLVDHFPHLVGRIERLLFSRPDWDAVSGNRGARQIQAARGAVIVSSFPSDDTHVMIIEMSSGQRLRLLVVPSDTAPELASRVMKQASDDRNTDSPRTLLGLSWPDQSEIAHAAWDDDSGNATQTAPTADTHVTPARPGSTADAPQMPEAEEGSSPSTAPAWATEQASAELYDTQDRRTINDRAWEIVGEMAQLEAERHNEYDDPDQGGEG